VTSLLTIFVHNILPVFLVVGTGSLLGVTLRPDVKSLSRTIFYVLTPCLIFSGLTRSPLSGAETGQIVVFAALTSMITSGLAWLAATLLRWESRRKRALLLPILTVNAGNFGLSVVLFAFGPEAQARAMIFFIAAAVLGNTLSVIVAAGGSTSKELLANIARVPMIYATFGALTVNVFEIQVPELLMRPINLMGGAAVPMLLLVLGLQLVRSVGGLRQHAGIISMATVFRLLVSPAIAFLLAVPLTGVQGLAYRASMLEASMPCGVTSIIIALEYDLEPEAVAGAVLVSTLASAFTLSVVISMIG
jgi:predicted permease